MRAVSDGHETTDMWTWLRMSITMSVARAVWGPMSPYNTDPNLWKEFWTFNSSYNILKYRLPRLFARKGAEAREKVVDAFVAYGDTGGFDHASALAQGRLQALQKTGLDQREMARMAMSQSVGQFDNAATVSFALLSRIVRDPELLAKVRAELEPLMSVDHNGHKTIDVVRVGDECPLLLSAFHEVLRFISVGVTARRVEKDYPLTIKSDGTEYLLRKGRFIWGSGVAIHTSEALFEDADKFVPERFLGMKYPETQIPEIFRAFGGGGNICLGRHYARIIVPGAIGALLATFDFEPHDGKQLCIQSRKDLLLGHATPNPFGNTTIELKLRA
ncbi:cytochrome P450 [Xylariales sp. AK1849]|nr:cytochrome P450 [Xylariales sp. AK1849]